MALHKITINTDHLLQSLSSHPTAVLFVRGKSGCHQANTEQEKRHERPSHVADSAAISRITTEHQRHLASSRYILAIQPLTQAQDFQTISDQAGGTSSSFKLDQTTQDLPYFLSGWAGLINYSQSFQQRPDIEFAYFDCVLYFDAQQNEALIASRYQLTDERVNDYHKALTDLINGEENRENRGSRPAKQRQWQAQWTLEDYQKRFNTLQDYLIAGDCYQVNLTCPFTCGDDLTQQSPVSLLDTFDAPMSGFFKHQDRWVASVSPERFLKIEDGRLETHPIKGTTPRSVDAAQDQALRQQLIDSEKNQAENLMIVDLLRNDLSISAKPNSVKVTELFKVESHHNVHQMVSAITADLKNELAPIDAIINAFPGGSITGAPKKRAMEIINELEIADRGAYCGSLGYIDDTGLCDFNILIRTIEATADGAVCWGGGGVTVQSTAEDEYNEILHKVGKILEHPI